MKRERRSALRLHSVIEATRFAPTVMSLRFPSECEPGRHLLAVRQPRKSEAAKQGGFNRSLSGFELTASDACRPSRHRSAGDLSGRYVLNC